MNSKIIRGAAVLAALLLLGSACQKEKGKVLGKAPSGDVHPILAVRDGVTPPNVTLRGSIIEKCPTAGCWFQLQDRTGVLKVDTKPSGFVVTDIPLETEVTVSGKLVYEGDSVTLYASGLRY
jgi:uncharacterized protein YdeI (BOF family)